MIHPNRRRGALRPRHLWAVSLLLVALATVWGSLYYWVDSSSRDLIYRQGQPELAVARLERWSPWMFSPRSWRWLTADAYRKAGDRGRVQRISDDLSASGMESVRANAPILLMDSAAGHPGSVKDNLGPLLITYRDHGNEVLAALVQGFLSQGDSMGANQSLRLWGELYEGDYLREYWRGVYFAYLYDLDAAVKAFKKSIELRPDYSKAHEELAEVFLEQAEFEEARAEYEWLMQHTEPSHGILTSYARSLLNLGYVDLASEQLAKLKDVTKLPSPELALVCQTNLESSNPQAASEQADILLRRWPNALPYLQLQARCMKELGKTEEGEALFAKAADSQNRRPQVDAMLNRLQTDPLNTDLRRDLGEMMMTYLDPHGGVGYIQIASRSNPTDIRSHELIATYMEREGNWETAENHRRFSRQIQQAMADASEMFPEGFPSNPNSPSNPSPAKIPPAKPQTGSAPDTSKADPAATSTTSKTTDPLP
jgi:tetratricopeptide (TPR) repeat protein